MEIFLLNSLKFSQVFTLVAMHSPEIQRFGILCQEMLCIPLQKIRYNRCFRSYSWLISTVYDSVKFPILGVIHIDIWRIFNLIWWNFYLVNPRAELSVCYICQFICVSRLFFSNDFEPTSFSVGSDIISVDRPGICTTVRKPAQLSENMTKSQTGQPGGTLKIQI